MIISFSINIFGYWWCFRHFLLVFHYFITPAFAINTPLRFLMSLFDMVAFRHYFDSWLAIILIIFRYDITPFHSHTPLLRHFDYISFHFIFDISRYFGHFLAITPWLRITLADIDWLLTASITPLIAFRWADAIAIFAITLAIAAIHFHYFHCFRRHFADTPLLHIYYIFSYWFRHWY